MNRPESMNALSGEMMELLAHAWDRINSDDEIRVAVLAGADGRFCAGADLKAMAGRLPDESLPGQPPPARTPQ